MTHRENTFDLQIPDALAAMRVKLDQHIIRVMDDRGLFVFKQIGSEGDIQVQRNEFRRMLSFFNHKWIATATGILDVIAGVFPIFMTWIVSSSFEAVLTPETVLDSMTGSLLKWCCMIIAMIVVMSTSRGLRSMENPDFMRHVRDALFRNIMEQELDYFDVASTGVLISWISEDVVYVLNTYIDKLNNCIQFGM
jgi:ABC-type multidrug transport system fused ATPase/permease subunit